MKVLVPVKRVVDFNVKIRVKSDQSLALPQRQALEEALDQQIEAVDELLADTPLLVEQVPEISQMVSNPAHERLREEVGRLRAEDVGYGQGVQRLEEFLRKLPPQARAGPDGLGLESPEALARVLADVEQRLLPLLLEADGS